MDTEKNQGSQMGAKGSHKRTRRSQRESEAKGSQRGAKGNQKEPNESPKGDKWEPRRAHGRLLYFYPANRDVSWQTGMFPGVTVAET